VLVFGSRDDMNTLREETATVTREFAAIHHRA